MATLRCALDKDEMTKDELRQAILGRLDTFTERVEWVGGSAELAFADSLIGLIDHLSQPDARPDAGRIEWESGPQVVRTSGDLVAYRNEEKHEPGRWWLINEARWINDAEVADWKTVP